MKDLLVVLLPILSGGLSTWLMTWLKKGVAQLGKLPAIAQQLIVGTGSWALIKVGELLAITFTTVDITQLADADMMALTAAGLAFIFHLGAQNKKLANGPRGNGTSASF